MVPSASHHLGQQAPNCPESGVAPMSASWTLCGSRVGGRGSAGSNSSPWEDLWEEPVRLLMCWEKRGYTGRTRALSDLHRHRYGPRPGCRRPSGHTQVTDGEGSSGCSGVDPHLNGAEV